LDFVAVEQRFARLVDGKIGYLRQIHRRTCGLCHVASDFIAVRLFGFDPKLRTQLGSPRLSCQSKINKIKDLPRDVQDEYFVITLCREGGDRERVALKQLS
jgi:hypothetical protein